MCTTDLRIPDRRLDRRSALHRDMSEIVGNFFEGPSSLTGAMSEVMAQIMKTEILDQFPFFFVCLLFEGTKLGVNAVFCEM
jgi:hypothetical protein